MRFQSSNFDLPFFFFKKANLNFDEIIPNHRNLRIIENSDINDDDDLMKKMFICSMYLHYTQDRWMRKKFLFLFKVYSHQICKIQKKVSESKISISLSCRRSSVDSKRLNQARDDFFAPPSKQNSLNQKKKYLVKT